MIVPEERTASIRITSGKKAIFLVVTSDIHAQNTRPRPFAILITPTRPAAYAELAFPNSPEDWGWPGEMIDNPAIVLRERKRLNAHHCHVFTASPRV